MSEVEVKLFERRRRQFMVHKVGRNILEEDGKLAKEFGCDAAALKEDWRSRADWLPDVLGVDEVVLLKEVVTGEFQRFVDECWDIIQSERVLKHPTAVNGAMKNLLAALVEKKELLQSLGDLPRMASEVKFEHDTRVEVKGNESDIDQLNKAAAVLDKIERSKKRPESLH